jgi:glycosyltransferase involved in cell wall biosynthesis
VKIAIIQNRIGLGGRNVVISQVIRLCNKNKITPVIFTFSSKKDENIFRNQFGSDLNFEMYTFRGVLYKRGTAYQTPLLNLLVAKKIKNFDIVFNSGRCPYFLPDGPKYIHYVHFPIEASLINEEHFQTLRGFVYTLPLKILYWGRAKRIKSGIFLANSNFTAEVILNIYTSLGINNVRVVYPPCSIKNNDNNNNKRDLDFVSLGSFISDKRQFEQIEIARSFPQYNFHLIGGLKSKRYFKKCQDEINKYKLNNVNLHPNAAEEKINELLSRSKIYLHTKYNEHFGISTVEAIDRGCIPLVHNSGGSCEIVPIQDLRFQNTEEAMLKGKQIIENYQKYKDKNLPILKKGIQQYGTEIFQAKMNDILFNNKITAIKTS